MPLTGTRTSGLRVFGGWDFSDDEVFRPDFVAQGYRRGVPMGGDLLQRTQGCCNQPLWFAPCGISNNWR